MSNMDDYHKKIGELVLHSVRKYVERENKLQRGGGGFRGEKPLPISSVIEPGMGTPSNSLSGGKFRLPKAIKKVGHEAAHVVTPVLKKAATKATEKVVSKLADKAVDALITGLTTSAETKTTGAGIKKRGRPKKNAVEAGGKINFIKSMKKVGHAVENVGKKVATGVANVATSRAINSVVDKGIAFATNPAVDAGLEEGAEVALCAAGMKKKRKPSGRNILIGQLMKKGMTMAQASKHIKDNSLK